MKLGTEIMEKAATSLLETLSGLGKSAKLQNVKFFLGNKRDLTAEEILSESNNAAKQLFDGSALPISAAEIDKGLEFFNISELTA